MLGTAKRVFFPDRKTLLQEACNNNTMCSARVG